MTQALSDLGPLFAYPIAPHNGTETSKDAADSIKPHVNRLCSEVLRCIQATPFGHTCDECECILHMSHQTCSARFRDLASCEPPFIIKATLPDGSPITRKTRSGRRAQVWIVNQEVA